MLTNFDLFLAAVRSLERHANNKLRRRAAQQAWGELGPLPSNLGPAGVLIVFGLEDPLDEEVRASSQRGLP